MSRAAVVLIATALVVVTGCGSDRGGETNTAGGLEAKLFDTSADDVFAGPAGVFALDGADLSKIDTASGDPDGEPIDIEALNARVAIGQGTAWVVQSAEGEAKRVSLPGGSIDDLKVPGGEPSLVVADGAGAWILSGRQLVPYSRQAKAGDPVRLPCEPEQLAASSETVWGTCGEGLVRIDAKGAARVVDVGGSPSSVAATSAMTWALVKDRLVGVSPAGKHGPDMQAPTGAKSLAGEGKTLWVVAGGADDRKAQRVTRHDARDGSATGGPIEVPGSTDDVGAATSSVAASAGSLWFTLAFYGGPLGVVREG